ncbi:hypothetical protein EV361DRAFT_983655 [Lentinula raphanica]|nr:hypothetical protein EV361DRAFT_983655 [Lentinula raphanica]
MTSLPTPSPALPAMRHTRSHTVTPTKDNDQIAEQRNAAEAHAILIGQQYSIANYRLNQKKKKKNTSKRISTSARILTSAEAQQEFAEAAARKAEEQRAKDLKQQQKDEQNRADILRRAEQELTQATFSGSLKSLNKSTLIDIAFALKVKYDGASAGTLRVRLNAHFDANEDLKQDPRFIGLFQWKCKRKDLPKENEDSESSLLPPTHRCQTKNHHSPTPGPSSVSNSDPSRSPIRHFSTQNASLLNPLLIPPAPFNLQLPTSLYQGPYLSTKHLHVPRILVLSEDRGWAGLCRFPGRVAAPGQHKGRATTVQKKKTKRARVNDDDSDDGLASNSPSPEATDVDDENDDEELEDVTEKKKAAKEKEIESSSSSSSPLYLTTL